LACGNQSTYIRMVKCRTTDLLSINPFHVFQKTGGKRKQILCLTRGHIISVNLIPYSLNASSPLAQGSTTIGKISYSASLLRISATLLFLISEQFSLKVSPYTTVLHFFGVFPAKTSCLIVASAIKAPMLSLTIRPLRMIWE
jgi:hypothetical protein